MHRSTNKAKSCKRSHYRKQSESQALNGFPIGSPGYVSQGKRPGSLVLLLLLMLLLDPADEVRIQAGHDCLIIFCFVLRFSVSVGI